MDLANPFLRCGGAGEEMGPECLKRGEREGRKRPWTEKNRGRGRGAPFLKKSPTSTFPFLYPGEITRRGRRKERKKWEINCGGGGK